MIDTQPVLPWYQRLADVICRPFLHFEIDSFREPEIVRNLTPPICGTMSRLILLYILSMLRYHNPDPVHQRWAYDSITESGFRKRERGLPWLPRVAFKDKVGGWCAATNVFCTAMA